MMAKVLLKSARILIVDDQQSNLLLLEDLLEREGYTHLRSVQDSRQVLATFVEFQPDLILLDLMMPYLDGFTLLEQLQALVPLDEYRPILVLTADVSQEAKRRALSSGAKDFLTKPIDVVEVILRVRNLLETRFLHRQLQDQNRLLDEKVRERSEQLAESEARNRAMLSAVPDLMFLFDRAGVYLDYHATDITQLIAPPEQFLGQPIRAVWPLDQAEQFHQLIELVAETRQMQVTEYAVPLHGLERYFEARLVPCGPDRVLAMVRDMTERKRADERIREESARAEALLRTASRLNARLDLDPVLEAVCEEAIQALHAPAASVALYDAERAVFYQAVSCGLPLDFSHRSQPLARAAHDALMQRVGPVLVASDVRLVAELPDQSLYDELNIRSAVSVTMCRDGQPVGALTVYTLEVERQFTEGEVALLKGLADQAALAITNARLFAETERRLQRLIALRAIDTAIATSPDLRPALNVVLDQVQQHLHVDAADILLFDQRTRRLEYAGGRGFRTKAMEQGILQAGEGYAGQVVLERRLVVARDLASSGTLRAAVFSAEGIVDYYGVPLIAKGEVKGVLEVFHRTRLQPDAEWMDFLETLAGQAAIAIDSAQLFEDLQLSNQELIRAYDTTIEGWSRALDLRDKETEGHSHRVTDMTLRLARALGFSEGELVNVRRGALLHDIGKMGIPDSILLKPGPLTSEEWEIMRKHPTYAYEMLSPIEYLQPALEIPYAHHERWDGTGYPRGLRESEIPLAARIFAVADVWDALRSDRPYRPGWPDDKVKEHIRSLSGKHFDPRVVEAFLGMLAEEHPAPLPHLPPS